MNLKKGYLGTGLLALPFATKCGGLGLSALGLCLLGFMARDRGPAPRAGCCLGRAAWSGMRLPAAAHRAPAPPRPRTPAPPGSISSALSIYPLKCRHVTSMSLACHQYVIAVLLAFH